VEEEEEEEEEEVSVMSWPFFPWYSSYRNLGGPKGPFSCSEEENNLISCWEPISNSSVVQGIG
jgi:hypothetical protein